MRLAAINGDEWWKTGVIYQVFPASYLDSNGDGYGDLRGLIEKLDYLEWLGIDAIWISPVFKSPLFDMGYDISDYQSVDPVFGNLDDLRELVEQAHMKGIRILLDLVLNHTSKEHPWFQESKSSVTNPKRDWYIWSDGTGHRKPNNWKSLYGGSAWSFDRITGQYYYHTFFKEQPDLNWRNREVRDYFHSLIRFWLDFGIDGFRLDVINILVKDSRLKDAPPSILWQVFGHENQVTRNQPESYLIIEELRELTDRYEGILLLGEIYTLPPGNPLLVGSYLAGQKRLLHLAFDFSLIFTPLNARRIQKTIRKSQENIPGAAWPCNVLSNHDLNRSMGYPSFRKHSDERTRLLALLLLTLKGTPFIYYGEEIGMPNSPIPGRCLRDPLGKRLWPLYPGRDPARTPMQWTGGANAGFSSGKPWLPVDRAAPARNVTNQLNDKGSILWFYRELLAVRKSSNSLIYGNWIPVGSGKKNVLAYLRKSGDETTLVILNFSRHYKSLKIPFELDATVLFSSHRNATARIRSPYLKLWPCEGTILLLRKENY